MPYQRAETYTTTGTKASLDLDPSIAPFNASVSVALNGAAVASYSLQYTFDDFSSPTMTDAAATWFTSSDIPLATAASANAAFITPVTRVRLVIASLSGGSMTMRTVQGMSTN